MKMLRISMAVVAVIPLALGEVFAQTEASKASEAAKSAPATAPATAPAAASAASPQGGETDAKEMAIYGEIQSVNASAGTVSIQYYDYDSDNEKTVEIASGPDTRIENAKSIGDIRKGDWADVTYTASGGRNIAKLITKEREEPEEAAAKSGAAEPPAAK
jgi:hypothetical protein